MSIVRTMREDDTDAVRQVDAVSFGAWYRRLYGQEHKHPQRTRTLVQANREKDPDGCFVAEDDGHVVGLVFSRTWGGAGWLGTFAVLPEYQGRGIGQQLMAASLEYLRRDPRRVVGLETMPDSPYDLGLYLRHGFQARLLTLILSKQLEGAPAGNVDLPRWSSADAVTQARWLGELREATAHIQPRLDYSKEITSTARHVLGETLVLTAGQRAVGLSTVWLTSGREGWGEELAAVQVMALHPAYTGDQPLHALLEATEALARMRGKREITLSVNSQHAWALDRLLQWGWRVDRSLVRMVVAGTDNGPAVDGYVNLCRWAG